LDGDSSGVMESCKKKIFLVFEGVEGGGKRTRICSISATKVLLVVGFLILSKDKLEEEYTKSF
jgi:hypothetical protein